MDKGPLLHLTHTSPMVNSELTALSPALVRAMEKRSAPLRSQMHLGKRCSFVRSPIEPQYAHCRDVGAKTAPFAREYGRLYHGKTKARKLLLLNNKYRFPKPPTPLK